MHMVASCKLELFYSPLRYIYIMIFHFVNLYYCTYILDKMITIDLTSTSKHPKLLHKICIYYAGIMLYMLLAPYYIAIGLGQMFKYLDINYLTIRSLRAFVFSISSHTLALKKVVGSPDSSLINSCNTINFYCTKECSNIHLFLVKMFSYQKLMFVPVLLYSYSYAQN